MTEEGKARLKEASIEGAYLGPDGRVHIPGKKVTLYSEPSPPLEELEQQVTILFPSTHTKSYTCIHTHTLISGTKVIILHCFLCRLVVPLKGATQTLTMT